MTIALEDVDADIARHAIPLVVGNTYRVTIRDPLDGEARYLEGWFRGYGESVALEGVRLVFGLSSYGTDVVLVSPSLVESVGRW